MGKFIFGLLEKLSNINIEELQSAISHLQEENNSLSSLLKEANQKLENAERRIEELQNTCNEFDPERQKEEIEQLRQEMFAEKENELHDKAQQLDTREQILDAKEIELQHNCKEREKALLEAELRLQELQHQLAEVKFAQQSPTNEIISESDSLSISTTEESIVTIEETLETTTDKESVNKEEELPTEAQPTTNPTIVEFDITPDAELPMETSSTEPKVEDVVTQLNDNNRSESTTLKAQKQKDDTETTSEEAVQPLPDSKMSESVAPDAPLSSTAITTTEETNQPEPTKEDKGNDILSLDNLCELKSKFPYIRVTLNIFTQYIFETTEVNVIVGLFEKGLQGHELISDKNIYIEENDIFLIEGLETPFAGDIIQCDFSDGNVTEQAAQTLLTAICTCQPLYATYDDKNGRITERNMYFICFKPNEKRFSLPYKNLFADLFNEDQELDTDNIAAMTQKQAEPKIFSVSQILTLRPYNAFVSTPQGIKKIKEGIKIAKKKDQKDFAKLIKTEILKRVPTMPQKLLGR